MRLLIQHQSRYLYPRAATLGPHLIRLRPANHAKAKIETYGLRIEQPCNLRWQQDPSGNHVARITFSDGAQVERLDLLIELAVDIRPVNPFDFFIDDRAEKTPFDYPPETAHDLLPFLDREDPSFATGPLFEGLLAELPREGKTVPLLVAINQTVSERVRYVIREESGIWTPEETLAAGRGSCRDSAVLLIALLRARGFAARFVSGYLVQLTDEGMIPNAPRGVGRDVVDLHAWTEVYVPGGGWVGFDSTSGLLCGEGHIPLACTAHPPFASPIEGTSDVVATDVSFSMTVGRLGHEPRPTAPYDDAVWRELVASGERADARLAELGIVLTMGGEPTFNSRDHADLPEWNTEALGADKWQHALALARELTARLAPGAALLHRAGKHYPGESLPRWALDIVGRADGAPIWSKLDGDAGAEAFNGRAGPSLGDARRVAESLAARLGLSEHLLEAFEDPWRFLQEEANLPVDVDPLGAQLDDAEERRRLTRVLGRGLGSEAGFVLPLARDGAGWKSERWAFRRGHLFLVPGDSPIGLRLPLRSLAPGLPLQIVEEEAAPPDPRRFPDEPPAAQHALPVPVPVPVPAPIRTALTVEVRGDQLHVFLPPLAGG